MIFSQKNWQYLTQNGFQKIDHGRGRLKIKVSYCHLSFENGKNSCGVFLLGQILDIWKRLGRPSVMVSSYILYARSILDIKHFRSILRDRSWYWLVTALDGCLLGCICKQLWILVLSHFNEHEKYASKLIGSVQFFHSTWEIFFLTVSLEYFCRIWPYFVNWYPTV